MWPFKKKTEEEKIQKEIKRLQFEKEIDEMDYQEYRSEQEIKRKACERLGESFSPSSGRVVPHLNGFHFISQTKFMERYKQEIKNQNGSAE